LFVRQNDTKAALGYYKEAHQIFENSQVRSTTQRESRRIRFDRPLLLRSRLPVVRFVRSIVRSIHLGNAAIASSVAEQHVALRRAAALDRQIHRGQRTLERGAAHFFVVSL
jgi:hypothetical protein